MASRLRNEGAGKLPSRSTGSQCHAVRIAYALFLACVAIAVIAPARAAVFKTVLCAVNNGPNDGHQHDKCPEHPVGVFDYNNDCWWPPDSAGDAGYLRIPSMNPTASLARAPYGRLPLRVLVANPL